MIKNDNQLNAALHRIVTLQQEIRDLRGQYSGLEAEMYTLPLEQEVENIQEQVREYRWLTQSTFEEAVDGLQRNPVVIEQIGELLSKLRIAAGLTQSELAERLGWQQPNLSRFESENYDSQTVNKIVEYASALRVWLHLSPSLTEPSQSPVDVGSQELDRFDLHDDNVVAADQYDTAPYGDIWESRYHEPTDTSSPWTRRELEAVSV